MTIGVIGAGAFGTALAIAQARSGRTVRLWGRSLAMKARQSARLPGVEFPEGLRPATLEETASADILLLAMPAQSLGGFVDDHRSLLADRHCVACAKGIDIARGVGPVGLLKQCLTGGSVSILTGPSFAADIAVGLPTALTLACADPDAGTMLQERLSTPELRLYRSTDTAGAELGGALKNVIAIACGAAMGAGLGDSARAALMTRGFAEMLRLAPRFGADPATLSGLSGLGDLALTCTSALSRNYRLGLHLGRGEPAEHGVTVEGAATARAMSALPDDLPICRAVDGLVRGEISVEIALQSLLARPLKEE